MSSRKECAARNVQGISESAFSMQVNGLDSLVQALDVEMKELRREKDRALESHTAWGHIKNSLGYCLSVYCLVRQVSSPRNCRGFCGMLPIQGRALVLDFMYARSFVHGIMMLPPTFMLWKCIFRA